MRARLFSRLSYANVIATVALFVALGGVGYAAATINSRDVIDNSLKSVDLKDGKAVKGVDVTDGSLTGADIDQSTLDVAFGRVEADGTLDGTHSQNIDAVTKPLHPDPPNDPIPGAYCIDVPFAPNTVQVELETGSGGYDPGGEFTSVNVDTSSSVCFAHDVLVRIERPVVGGTTLTDFPFYVVLH